MRFIRYPLFLALWLASSAAAGEEAVITGPSTGIAGYPVRLYTAGSEGTRFEWAVIPLSATLGLSPDADGRSVVFSVPYNGDFAVILLVDREASAVHNLTLTDGEPGPPPDDPPPLPPPLDLSEYTKRLTDNVLAKAREFGEVSSIFFALAVRINSGDLDGSGEILPATAEALFGTEGDLRENWKAWHTAVMTHLRDDLHLGLDDQWAASFEVIGEAVKR